MFRSTQDIALSPKASELLNWAYGIASDRDGFSFLPLEMKKALLVYLLTTQELLGKNSLSDKESVEEAIRFLDSEELVQIGKEPNSIDGLVTIGEFLKVNPSAYPHNFTLTKEDEWELEDVYAELERTTNGWSFYPLEVKKSLMITALLEKSNWCNVRRERQKELAMVFLDRHIVIDVAPFRGV